MKRLLLVSALIILFLQVSFCYCAAATDLDLAVLEPDSNTHVLIDNAGKIVKYQFVPEYSCLYSFYSVSEEDTYAELYDGDGNLLYENDDYYGMNFGIECTLEAGRTYVLEVCFLDTASIGSFDLFTRTNHDEVSELVKDYTCLEDGIWVHSCRICNSTWTEIIPAEHAYENGVCTICGASMVLSGICGDELTWHFDGATGTLRISGIGAMYDYEEDAPPWRELDTLAKTVIVEDGVTSIGKYAFFGLEAVERVELPDSLVYIADNGFSYCGGLEEIVLPDGLRTVGVNAFAYCDLLTEVIVPASVTDIGFGAFQGCKNLTAIRVDDGNAAYSTDENGVLYDKRKKTLIQAPEALEGVYVIPNTVTAIADSAFFGCYRLDGVTIGENVTTIGPGAFAGCNSLVFVRIPAGVTSIGESAFGGCTDLQGVLFAGDAPTVDGMIFEDVGLTAYYYQQNQTWTEDSRNAMGEDITWQTVSGLTIVTQPETEAELFGNRVVLTVGASGENLQYAWWVADSFSGVFVKTDATGSVYEVVLTKETVGQQIYCVVTDETGKRVQTQTVTLVAMTGLEEDTPVSVELTEEGEFTYFFFTPSHSCFYTFYSAGSLDTYCELYDAQYYLLEAGDEGEGQNFRLHVLLEAGKTYILGVRHYDATGGTVTLEVKTNHDYVETVCPPGCTEDGYTAHVCATCGLAYYTDSVPAIGHNYSPTVIAPTCSAAGYTRHTCANCGNSYTTDPVNATGHSYQTAVTAPTCTEDGYTTNTCNCGHSYRDVIPATGHSYQGVVTPPTCSDAGYTTYTCHCGASYVEDLVEPAGHSWADADCTEPMHCTICGVQQGVAAGHAYKSVVTPPTCTAGGFTINTCTVCGHTETVDVRNPLGHSYQHTVVNAGCTSEGYTIHTCSGCGDTYKDGFQSATGHIWLEATCTQPMTCSACGMTRGEALGHIYKDGVCTECGAAGSDAVTDPGLAVDYPSVSFESEILYNIYFTVENMTDVVEMGLVTFETRNANGTISDALHVYPGYSGSDGSYMAQTEGISAKNLGDAVYFKVYAKLSDGSYVYTDVAGYHAVAYAKSILKNSSNSYMKSLVVAMVNYGAEAQKYFHHNEDSLMNSFLTDAQKALVTDYRASMINGVVAVDSTKAGSLQYNGSSYAKRVPTVSFDGAFAINYYFTTAVKPDSAVKLYYWTLEDYNAATTLSPKNASGSMTMTLTEDENRYWGQISGIAAKELDETVFVVGVYSYNGTTYSTGVLNYHIGKYCAGLAAKDTSDQQDLAKATAVYGYYAKEYFANL